MWRVRGGPGACSGRSRFLFACNGGCIGFVEVLMSQCYSGKQLQIARRLNGGLKVWKAPRFGTRK